MQLTFGPAGIGPVKTATEVLEEYHKKGLRACEIAFTYSVYIKEHECAAIKKKAEELEISGAVAKKAGRKVGRAVFKTVAYPTLGNLSANLQTRIQNVMGKENYGALQASKIAVIP